MNLRTLTNQALSLLYPPACPVCGTLLPRKAPAVPNPLICPSCYRRISFPQEPRCLKCSRPVPDEAEEYCYDCRQDGRFFDSGTALMMHDEISRKILYDLKYYNRRENARMLACEAALREGKRVLSWKPQVMIPVPLHPKKERRRGFNQSALLASYFSEYLSKQTDLAPIPVDTAYLLRIKRTPAQKELSGRQRMENVRDAFSINYQAPKGQYFGKTVLLVDDIYTSGATLSECARVLKEAGVKRVHGLCFGLG